MKLLKICVSILAAVLLVACGDDDSAPSFSLNDESIAGTYSMDELVTVETSSTITADGTTSSEKTEVGDTFSVNLVLSDNGTFTISGGFRLETTITGDNGNSNNAITTSISDSGVYTLDADDKIITFISSNDQESEFLNGTYDIDKFSTSSLDIVNETSGLIQEDGSSTNFTLNKEYYFSIDR